MVHPLGPFLPPLLLRQQISEVDLLSAVWRDIFTHRFANLASQKQTIADPKVILFTNRCILPTNTPIPDRGYSLGDDACQDRV